MLSWNNQTEDPLWVYPKTDPQLKESIIKEFKIHPVIAQILVSRGFSSLEQIHDYLYAKLPDLYDPFLLAEMPQAVDRIMRAIKNSENILIYGDNDVDGMTGTALLTEFLQFVGGVEDFHGGADGGLGVVHKDDVGLAHVLQIADALVVVEEQHRVVEAAHERGQL